MSKTFSYLEKEKRPWGVFYVIHEEKNYKLKRLDINPDKRLSYQFHNKRSESWIVIDGNATVIIDGIKKNYSYGETIIIPKQTKHRIENNTDQIISIIEIQTGTYFGEDDIVRLEDDYNR